jgi:hypothetical protein
MDFPIHFQREIHRKKKSRSIRKMPAILSQEFCDGFANAFPRKNPSRNPSGPSQMSTKMWLCFFFQQRIL